jgi:hypothetical protein
MKTLKPIKCGWKWLEQTFNTLIDSINERTVSVSIGSGLDAVEHPNGVMLNLSSSTIATQLGVGPTGGTPGAGGTPGLGGQTTNLTGVLMAPNGVQASWIVTNVIIEVDGGYAIQQMWYWGAIIEPDIYDVIPT